MQGLILSSFLQVVFWNLPQLHILEQFLLLKGRMSKVGKSGLFAIAVLVLSAVQNRLVAQITADSSAKEAVKEVLRMDHNVVLNDSSLRNFYHQLELVKQGKRDKITILHIGDSHIQGDHFSGTIRAGLQEIFGSAGRGLVFPYAVAKTYAPGDLTASSNVPWTSKRNFFQEDSVPLGITGYALVCNDPDFQLRMGVKDLQGIDYKFDRVCVLHGNDSSCYDLGLYRQDAGTNSLKEMGVISCYDSSAQQWGQHTVMLDGHINELVLQPVKNNTTQQQARIYGFVLENSNEKGILYNTAGVGAAQLVNFTRTTAFLDQAASLNPDLIIFSLGTNESYSIYFDTLGYQELVENVVQQLRQRVPKASFLFTTPPDIVYKYRHPKYMHPVCRAIKRAAYQQNFAVWDLNFVMGGTGSMNQWHSNALAQNDHIHFQSAGYRLQGYMFLDALMYSYNRFAEEAIDVAYLGTYIEKNKPSFRPGLVTPVLYKNTGAYGYKYHVVRSGETLSGIARKYGTTVSRLCQLNGISTKTVLRIGRRLRVR
jgi:lysophospholipase L1-like esterase